MAAAAGEAAAGAEAGAAFGGDAGTDAASFFNGAGPGAPTGFSVDDEQPIASNWGPGLALADPATRASVEFLPMRQTILSSRDDFPNVRCRAVIMITGGSRTPRGRPTTVGVYVAPHSMHPRSGPSGVTGGHGGALIRRDERHTAGPCVVRDGGGALSCDPEGGGGDTATRGGPRPSQERPPRGPGRADARACVEEEPSRPRH